MAICNCHDFFPGTFVKVFVSCTCKNLPYPHVLWINQVNSFKATSLVKTAKRAIEETKKKNAFEKCRNCLKQTFP